MRTPRTTTTSQLKSLGFLMPKLMRVFYDFEFLEDYGSIDPISVGFVREDGKELYIVFNDFNTLAVARHRWLMHK